MPDLAAGVGIRLVKEPSTDLLRVSTSVVSGRLAFATYADLAAVTDQAEGTPAEVPVDDAGTHTDPVVGGTVDNSGIYSWSDSPAGWQRIADVDALSAEPFATAAAASATAAATSETNAAASAVEATALAHFLDTDSLATIDGVEPLGLIGLRDADDVLWSFIAFMPGGTISSPPIEALITAKLAGVTFSDVTAPGFGSYVFAQRGSDGLLYAVGGVRDDNSFIGASASPSYPPTEAEALPTADVPNYLSTGWNGFITYGQSLSMGEGGLGKPAVSTVASATDKTFGSGVRSGKPGNTAGAVNTTPGTTTTIALVEQDDATAADGITTAGESPCSGAASSANRYAARDNGIDPASFVKFCSAAGHGSYSISDLSGAWYAHFTDHVSQAKARATAAGKGYALPAVLWMQGENNAGAGTSRASYLASLTGLRSTMNTDVLALTSQSAPVHMLTYQTASNPTGTLAQLNEIQLAQMDAVNQDAHIHFVGPIYHLPHGAGVSADGIHLNAIGYRWFGEYAGRAYKQLVIDGNVPDCIWPVSAIANGTTLRVKLRVPQRPLVFDSESIGFATDYGFKVTDGTGTLTLSDIEIIDGDTVQMTLNRTLGTSPKVRYALDYLASNLVLTAGASGNLRDSTADSFTFGGSTYSLAHWSPHFELSVLSVEF